MNLPICDHRDKDDKPGYRCVGRMFPFIKPYFPYTHKAIVAYQVIWQCQKCGHQEKLKND